MKGLSEEVREIIKEYTGDNSVAGVTVLAVQDGKDRCPLIGGGSTGQGGDLARPDAPRQGAE